MSSRSSLPETRSYCKAGGSAGGLTDTICRGLNNINRMTIYYTTCWDLTVASPASSYVTAYNVERREQGAKGALWSKFTATENSFTDSTVVAGTS